ncbi:MAG TPA: M14 family metallopeptidase [Pyrinomonadaceae bacterium]|nr:M14 family metallopeptidase [Pyrinomonadaceae bacterium]
MLSVLRGAVVVALLLLAASAPRAQRFEFYPGGTYDATVPTPESVLGYAVGTYHTDYAGLERWLAALRQSPRVRVVRYGESVERRPLYLVVVSSPENLARLDAVKDAMRRLSDPRATSETEAARLASSLPAVAWLNHANDGNESAAFESAIQSSYQLAAGTDDATRLILERLVVVINPAHNPESHERFVAWYNSAQVGRDGTPDPAAAEHNAPWGMDTNNNHYQIDLNRDAFFVTQRETLALVRAFNEWNPVVFVDHHGQTKNMFFPPPAEAINLNVTPAQAQWMNRYGERIAAAFDRHGWSYYRRGRFDLFYAGFWDSWPTLNGSIGMTFETDAGGDKGLAYEREDKTVLTLREGVMRHFTGAMATLQLTAEHKEQRLRDFYEYKKSAMEEGRREPLRQIVFLPGRDERRARMLAETLREQRVEVYRTSRPVRLTRAHPYAGGAAGAREIPAGAFVVPMSQPQKRLARAILELEPAFKEEFLKEEERKKRRADLTGERQREGFYDVTAWSLPLLYGLEAFWSEDAPDVNAMIPFGSARAAGENSPVPRASYGYVFGPESFGSMRLVAQLMREGFNTVVATEPFRVGGRDFARGSVLARVERNSSTLHERINALAVENGVALLPLLSARADSGPDFGEDSYVELVNPRVAVVTDEPTDTRAYGATWFTLEERLGYNFTALKIDQLKSADLRRYDVIVFPHGPAAAFQEMLGEGGVNRLRRWTDDGGTIVLIKGAAAFATRRGVEWTSSTLKRRQASVRLFFENETEPKPEPTPARATAAGEGRPAANERTENETRAAVGEGAREPTTRAAREDSSVVTREAELPRIAGALVRVRVDPEHFLGYGYEGETAATVSSNFAFQISRQGRNVAAYPDENSLRLAGFMWPESRAALAKTLYLWQERAGRGQVILFADDPNFRAAQLSTMRLFFNAVLLGPSFTGR